MPKIEKEIKEVKKKELVKKTLGVILILIGIAGLFLPIIPGIILIFAGLLLLGNKRVKKIYLKIKKKVKRWLKKRKAK